MVSKGHVEDSLNRGIQLVDVNHLAELLQVSPRCVRRWLKDGHLPPAVRLGGGRRSIRWRVEDIEVFVEARRVAGAHGIPT
jgi:excisionase family DNA binding protein